VRHACLHGAAGQGPIASSGSHTRNYNVELNATVSMDVEAEFVVTTKARRRYTPRPVDHLDGRV
jgi:hypothetical protein